MNDCTVLEVKLLRKQRHLWLKFADGFEHTFSCYELRVNSPSAEMRDELRASKIKASINPEVNIIQIEPVGNYALKLVFDDGHQTGIYSWNYLRELAER